MKTKLIVGTMAVVGALVWSALILSGQRTGVDIPGTIIKDAGKPTLAVPDFRGAGAAQAQMGTFNQTLWDAVAGSGVLKMAAKGVYPLEVPQQPTDFKPPTTYPPLKRGDAPRTVSNGPWLTDWSGPPVNANYLAFGYSAVQDNQIVLRGYLYNLGLDLANAQTIGKLYYGPLDAAGAKKVANEFAADILQQFGVQSLSGSKIYFASDRTKIREIWSMDYDGSNQRQLTNFRVDPGSSQPAVSADGTLLAYSTYAKGNPRIMVQSIETGRQMPFYNPVSSVVATPEFTPDGKHMMFSAAIDGWVQLCMSDLTGGNMQRISHVKAIEVSPRINPKTGKDVLFISGRSQHQQLWRMNIEGGDLEMLTSGEGDVANPSWSPSGQMIAFAWTRGYEIGGFNIFIMDVAKREYVQLTHGMGRNENPWWAPDGLHLVFTSKRGNATQVYSMLADGTNVQQLTTQGNNIQPVWAKGLN